ncbi:MAG: tetratricopeptide repeat protein [Flavobacteriales bacterium]
MKHLLVFLTLLAGMTAAWAQPEVVSAYNANSSGDYAKAIEYIEKAMSNPKATAKDKTWRYRGEIYYNVVTKGGELARNYPNALRLSLESYMKARELDVKGFYERETTLAIGLLQTAANNAGIELYNAGDFANAGIQFDMAHEVAVAFKGVDTVAVFNAALCYEKSEQLDLAVARYRTCGEYGYQVPNVYLFAASLLRKQGNVEGALAELQAARQKYPREQGLVIEELNIYLESRDYARAESAMDVAIELDGTNEILWFSKGSVLDGQGKTDDAAQAYQRAIALKPDYFDANYNLGAMYFNQAVQDINAANELWNPRMTPEQKTEQSRLETQAKARFEQAKPYLEKAHEVNPEDRDTMRSLRDVYTRTGDNAKLEAINAKLNAGQ